MSSNTVDPSEVPLPTSQESGTDLPVSPEASDCCSIQTVSTATYHRQEREAQEHFNKRIEQLCQDLWPPPQSIKHRLLSSKAAVRLRTKSMFRQIVPQPEVPLIEHFKGGGYNHITAVRLPPSYVKDGNRDLILRIPREDESRPDHQAAMLDFVRSRTSIPVPTIVAADFTGKNTLEKPYVLQNRIPGQDLESLWDGLSHSQRCVVATELGKVVNALLLTESSVTGTIEADPRGMDAPKGSAIIVPWKLESRGKILEELEPERSSSSQTPEPRKRTLEFFKSYLGRWRKGALDSNLGEVDDEVLLFDSLLLMAQEMNDMGLFKPDTNCLCHLDLHELRNIMVQVDSDYSLRVTGILDWDEAIVAPKFVNCQPPGWLWGYDKDTHEDENGLLPWPYELEGANNEPATPEKQELKQLFEEYAGPDYPRLAYDTPSRFMRTMFRIAIDGLNTNWHCHAAERVVKEWNDLRPSLIPTSSSSPNTG